MRCSEIIDKLEILSPASYAEDWDNVGLLVGRSKKEVNSVLLALDATDSVIDQAIHMNADMIITHHPMIFHKISKVNNEDFVGRRIINLIKNDISYYVMHTNFDVMGMADAVADEFQLRNREVLDITYEDEISKEGIGRIGFLPEIMSLKECVEYCKKVYGLTQIKVFGDLSQIIERAAIVPGSGKDYIGLSIEKNADVIITGDIDHHNGIDAVMQGINVIDAGHYGLEKIFVPYIEEVFKREMPKILIYKAKEENPFVIF